MKGFSLILLCFVAAAQARTAVQTSSRIHAELGENPWFVHLRIAVSTSGFLQTCAGSLIGNSWVLTARDCINDSRFIWTRYGVVRVYNPSLVTEGNQVRLHPTLNVGLISIGRYVHFTDKISSIGLAPFTEEVESATFCGFGEHNDAPGEYLNCHRVDLEELDDTYIAISDEVRASRFDLGAPLVKDGKQIGILTSAASYDSAGTFVSTASVLEWIEEETGLPLS